jgi:NADH:ubiquinone oxidoreductase subunit E
LGLACGETTADGKFTLETCECLGICDISPAVMINDEVFGNLTPEGVPGLLAKY